MLNQWFLLAVVVSVATLGKIVWDVVATRLRLKRVLDQGRDYVMLEILTPKEIIKQENESPPQLKEIISVMEQFLTNLSGYHVAGVKGWFRLQPVFSLEIVARHGEIRFFVGTPQEFESAIEKQILGYYPEAQVFRSENYRIVERGYDLAGSQLRLIKRAIFPIQTYNEVESDPLQTLTSSLSKMGTDSRALIQVLIQPTDNGWRYSVDQAIRRIQEGRHVDATTSPWWLRAMQFFTKGHADETKVGSSTYLSPAQQEIQKVLQSKGSKLGFKTVINVVTVAPDKQEARFQLANILSAFSQYNTAQSNGFKAKRVKKIHEFLIHVLLRSPLGRGMVLNTAEIASIYHPPNFSIDTPGVVWLLARFAPAPPNLPSDGLLLGENVFRGQRRAVYLKDGDRLRHLYAIGMTGTGKSTFFEHLVLQDIRAGRGACYIDPHGDVVESVLRKIPKERADDVVYFDPGDLNRPVGLNLLEWHKPEEKDFLINEFLLMFYKLFDPNRTGMIGPQFEHWARNAALTVMANPDGGGTLIEIPRLFTDDAYREGMIRHVDDPVVLRFWNEQMAKTADFHKSEMFNYFISKFGRFMTNELMRNIIGQPQSGINFREIMDSGKILLINLSKGKIGDLNASLLGMIVVAKLNSAALARQDVPEESRREFYLYVDEFHNLATDTFASILSEARKYRLSLNITHQYIAQLPDDVRNAVFGNVGTLIAFRIGVDDAKYVAPQFLPVFHETDLMNIERYNAYVKFVIDNTPVRPFSVSTLRDDSVPNDQLRDAVVALSNLKHGRDRREVDALIRQRAQLSQGVGALEAVGGKVEVA